MSEFLAEARILVRPDTSRFRTELRTQLAAATKGVIIPIGVTPVLAKGALGAAVATSSLATSAKAAAVAEEQLAGASVTAAAAARVQTLSTNNLNAALLGLRTAIGSSAVIGLGAVSLAAIAAGQALRQMLQDTAAFERELSTLGAVTDATASELATASQAALRLGADIRLPAVSAADAAVAITELAKAGLTLQEAIAGAEGVLQLATAAQISNAEAAQITANALNSFGLAGDRAVLVADELANAANASQGSISDMGLALRQASAVAKQVGLSLTDTNTILSLFAKNGLQGSDAGTSLRVALIRLVAPTSKAADEIERLGLKIRDMNGNLRPDILAQFGEATRNFSNAQRDASAALIFGQDAIRAASIGAREGREGIKLMRLEIEQQGTAAEVAAARTEGLGGAFSALQSNAQTLGIQLGLIVSGPLQAILDTINENITVLSKFADQLRKLATIKIPPITIPLKFVNVDLPGGTPADLVGRAISETSKTILQGGIVPRAAIAGVRKLAEDSDEAAKRIQELKEQIDQLQQAAVLAAKGGQFGVAARLRQEAVDARKELRALQTDATSAGTATQNALQKSVDILVKLRDALPKGADTSSFDTAIARLNARIQALAPNARESATQMRVLRQGTLDLGQGARVGAAGVAALTAALSRLTQQSTRLSDQLQKARAEGASPQTQISLLQQANANARARIAQAEAGGRQAGDITTIRKARDEIIKNNAEIKSLQDGIVSVQKAAATAAEKDAKDAQTQRDKQFQAIADMFGGRQENIQNQIERAGIADNIQKQINLTKALVASLLKERAALLDRLKKLKVSNEVRKTIMEAINRAIEQAKQDILRLNKEQADNLASFSTPAIDLRIRIAQARDNVAQEIALRRQRLQLITKELIRLKNAGKKNSLAWLELKAQQAEEAAAIRDLQKQVEKTNNAGVNLFKSMQSLQGFSANLLGNLIPGFATGGLVGNTASPAPSSDAAALGAGVQQDAGLRAAEVRGVRPVQVDTTNSLLRQILATLQGRHSKGNPPEIVYNRGAGSAVADIF